MTHKTLTSAACEQRKFSFQEETPAPDKAYLSRSGPLLPDWAYLLLGAFIVLVVCAY